MIRFLFFTLFLLSLSGCASMDASGPAFQKYESIPQGKSLIYLLKPDSASQDGVTACLALKLDDKEYGCVKGKGYVLAEVEPGNYKAALINKSSFGFKLLQFDLVVPENEVVYLEYAFGRSLNGEVLDSRYAGLGVVFSGNHAIAPISELEALNKLSSLFESGKL